MRSAGAERVALFARYNLAGALAGALGSLAAGVPELLAGALGAPRSAAFRAAFVIYGLAALPIAAALSRASRSQRRRRRGSAARAALALASRSCSG